MSLRDRRTQQILITSVAGAALLWSFFIADVLPFGYRRRAAEVAKMRGEYETVSAELEKARRTVSDLPQLEKENAELLQKWQEAQQLLPTEKEMSRLLTQITQAGEDAGVTFELFKPDTPKPQEFYNENPIEVKVSAGYHQLGIFLSRVANLSRLVNVSQLHLDGDEPKENEKNSEAGRGDQTLKADFVATAYSLRDEAAEQQAPPAEPGAERKLHAGKPTKGVGEAKAAAAKLGGAKPAENAATKKSAAKSQTGVKKS